MGSASDDLYADPVGSKRNTGHVLFGYFYFV